MNDTLRITLVANAGVLLAYDGVTILLDGTAQKEDITALVDMSYSMTADKPKAGKPKEEKA